jgi:hypothetical protein
MASETNTVSPLRQHMIGEMVARKLNPHTQRSHIHTRKQFAAWLKRSPDTTMPDEVRRDVRLESRMRPFVVSDWFAFETSPLRLLGLLFLGSLFSGLFLHCRL